MRIEFFEGLASTVNDVFNPLFDLAFKVSHALKQLFSRRRAKQDDVSVEVVEPYR